MGDILGLLGALGFVAAILMAIARLLVKRGLTLRQAGILAVVSVVVFFTGAIISGTPPEPGGEVPDAIVEGMAPQADGDKGLADEGPSNNDAPPAPAANAPVVEAEKVLIEDVGQKLMEITEGHRDFSDVTDIRVYRQDNEALGSRTWAEVHTSYIKDWDDDGYCEQKAKMVMLQAFTNDLQYIDEARVFNADGLQVASMQNWLPKE